MLSLVHFHSYTSTSLWCLFLILCLFLFLTITYGDNTYSQRTSAHTPGEKFVEGHEIRGQRSLGTIIDDCLTFKTFIKILNTINHACWKKIQEKICCVLVMNHIVWYASIWILQVNYTLFAQLWILICPPNTYRGIFSLKEVAEILWFPMTSIYYFLFPLTPF